MLKNIDEIENLYLSNVGREIEEVVSKTYAIELMDDIDQVKKENLEIREALRNALKILEAEQKKQDKIKELAFVLANKL